jgi:hypothetical protein
MIGRSGQIEDGAMHRHCARRAIAYGWVVVVACAGATPAGATCSCQCVEGVARTACTSVDEARDNPNECGPTVACTLPPVLSAPPERYAAPQGGIDCRARRLWDPQTNEYSVVAKVCDLAPIEAGG